MQTVKANRQLLSGDWALWDENPNEWELLNHYAKKPNFERWRQVKVPGSVHEALWKRGEIKHPYHNLNSRASQWIEHRDWIYGKNLELNPALKEGAKRVFLEFEGISEKCRLFLNGSPVGSHDGAGVPFELEITQVLGENDPPQLQVLIPTPTPEDPQVGWTERTRGLRGRMGYGWDFAPRLVRVGLLGEVSLRFTGEHHLKDFWCRPKLDLQTRQAAVQLEVKVDGPVGAGLLFEITLDAEKVGETFAVGTADGYARASLALPDPQLWWPAGMGDQTLYTARVSCLDGSDNLETTFGLREIAWQRQPDNAGHEWPLTLVVNGKPVFQRGWNWVPADALGGPRADRKMKHLVELARHSGANILRCWGGGDPESPEFYAECDRLGLLVWQELPLSSGGISNLPPDDLAYFARLTPYLERVIKARRNHPSLALWGGGNELTYSENKPLTMEHPLPQLMAGLIEKSDPDRAFRPSSPLGASFGPAPDDTEQWDVHGPWTYQTNPPGPEYKLFNTIRPLLHSELGLPGETRLGDQKRFLARHFRSRAASNPARRHHDGAWWEHREIVEAFFGPVNDDKLAILASQWLQAEGLRYYVEETRRRWPHSAGIYLWQFNEPWPTVTCTSAVQYSGRPKLAYQGVRKGYQPVTLTARYDSPLISKDAPLRVSLWAASDTGEIEGELVSSLKDLSGRELGTFKDVVKVPGANPAHLRDLDVALPGGFEGVVVLDLSLADKWKNRYLFSNLPVYPFRKALKHPELLKGTFS
jgi:beta-mannosidase